MCTAGREELLLLLASIAQSVLFDIAGLYFNVGGMLPFVVIYNTQFECSSSV